MKAGDSVEVNTIVMGGATLVWSWLKGYKYVSEVYAKSHLVVVEHTEGIFNGCKAIYPKEQVRVV